MSEYAPDPDADECSFCEVGLGKCDGCLCWCHIGTGGMTQKEFQECEAILSDRDTRRDERVETEIKVLAECYRSRLAECALTGHLAALRVRLLEWKSAATAILDKACPHCGGYRYHGEYCFLIPISNLLLQEQETERE